MEDIKLEINQSTDYQVQICCARFKEVHKTASDNLTGNLSLQIWILCKQECEKRSLDHSKFY